MQSAASRLASAAGLRRATLAGRVPPSVWKRLPVTWPFRTEVAPGRSFEYLPVRGDLLARPLFWRGLSGKEPETMGTFVELVSKARVFCDVGANTGVFTLAACAANPAVRVHAFEPVERVAARLEDNLAANGFRDRCEVHRTALTSTTGAGVIRVPTKAVPTSAHLEGTPERAGTVGLQEVALSRLDDVVDPDEAVDLVKIDVEGAELDVVRGMPRTLATWHPAMLVECLPDGPVDELTEDLAAAGYEFLHLRRDGIVRRERIVPDPERRDRNYLFVHPDGALRP